MATWPSRCFPEGHIGMFEICSFAIFSKVFIAGFSITCPFRFHDIDVGSPLSINRGQFEVVGDKDGQVFADH